MVTFSRHTCTVGCPYPRVRPTMVKGMVRRSQSPAPFAGWRIPLFIFLIATFALQSFVVQTHIHLPGSVDNPSSSASTPVDRNATGSHHKNASKDDTANCPICQEYLYVGNYVAPAAIFVLPPSLAVSTIVIVTHSHAPVWAISHSWQGRAPPSL